MKVNCKNCNKEFEKTAAEIRKTKNNFCSRSCAASLNNKGRQRNKPVDRKCKKCNSDFTRHEGHQSISFCQECFPRWGDQSNWYKSLTLQEYQNRDSVKDKHPSWRNANVRNFCRSWNKDLREMPCKRCGYPHHVELCHIKAIASFPDNITLGEINSPDNILVLCRNCHWEFDNNMLDIVSIPSRNSG